jgi:hypothetical protein
MSPAAAVSLVGKMFDPSNLVRARRLLANVLNT